MEMNQFYNPGAVQNSGNLSQQYSTYNSWTSEYVKSSENYNTSMMLSDSFNNQTNNFYQYNQMLKNNSINNQGPTISLQNQNSVTTNSKSNMQKSDCEDSPALRALLTNPVKKIKYNPNYYSNITNKSDEFKINQIKEVLTSVECPSKVPTATALTRNQLTPVLDSAVLSPQSSEPEYQTDYLNSHYPNISQSTAKDGFASPALSNTPSILPELGAGSPFEISPPPSTSSVASTISNSPPPSPIGQKFALSSQNMTPSSSWLPNGIGHQAPMNNLAQQLWMTNKDVDSYLTEDNKGKRSRQTYSRSQTHMLELSFYKSTYLSRQRRSELSKELNLTERQVKIWFQNRRMKEKKVKGAPTAEKKSPPQPQFMSQPSLGYVKSAPSTITTTASYQPPAGYQAHHNTLGVSPRPPISQNISATPPTGFNMVPSSASVQGQFMHPSYDIFTKRSTTLPTGIEHHFPQQPFGTNQYSQFPYSHQNPSNYLASTCNYGQYPIRPSNISSSTDFSMVAPNVFAG